MASWQRVELTPLLGHGMQKSLGPGQGGGTLQSDSHICASFPKGRWCRGAVAHVRGARGDRARMCAHANSERVALPSEKCVDQYSALCSVLPSLRFGPFVLRSQGAVVPRRCRTRPGCPWRQSKNVRADKVASRFAPPNDLHNTWPRDCSSSSSHPQPRCASQSLEPPATSEP